MVEIWIFFNHNKTFVGRISNNDKDMLMEICGQIFDCFNRITCRLPQESSSIVNVKCDQLNVAATFFLTESPESVKEIVSKLFE